MSDPVLEIDINIETGDWPDLVPDLEQTVATAARAAIARARFDGSGAELSVLLTGNGEMAALNEKWRGKSGPTNVLSFPGELDGDGPAMIGDIVLALETIAAEASAARISAPDHFSHLVVHGVLHLLGFDHETDREAEEMESLETEILESIGIADPYAAGKPALSGSVS